jgi:hypothetical protein
MPHTKEKTMINTNRAVIVRFAGNANANQVTTSGTADIYVPFKVSQINVRGVDLDFDSDFRMMYFTSNLVNSEPLGSGYAGILSDTSTTTKQMTYLFEDPRDINGNYTFTYHILDTTAFYFLNGFVPGIGPDTSSNVGVSEGSPMGKVIFMLEFIGYK